MSNATHALTLTAREAATIQAALRCYQLQGFGDMHKLPPTLASIAVDGESGRVPLDDNEIDDLFRALAPRPAAASTRWHVEHEFDDEPTHVVDTLGEHDNTDVDFGPGISVPLRRTLARLVADSLNQAEQAGGAA